MKEVIFSTCYWGLLERKNSFKCLHTNSRLIYILVNAGIENFTRQHIVTIYRTYFTRWHIVTIYRTYFTRWHIVTIYRIYFTRWHIVTIYRAIY